VMGARQQLRYCFGWRSPAGAREVLQVSGVRLLRAIGPPHQKPSEQLVRASFQRPFPASIGATGALDFLLPITPLIRRPVWPRTSLIG
jgi:hypothetical protein